MYVLLKVHNIIPQGPGGPCVRDGDVSVKTVTNIPGDTLAVSIGNRGMVAETLDELCISPVKHLLGLMLCALDCPCLSPFLFVSVGGGVSSGRGQLVISDSHRDCWEPGETQTLISCPRECVSVLCQDFTPKLDLNLIYRLSDLVYHFELLCEVGGYDVLLIGAHPVLFEWVLLPLALFVMVTLDVTGVRFDVSGVALLRGGDLVRIISRLMMSDDTGDGDWSPMAMTARSRTAGFGCCGWLYCVARGAGLVASLISERGRTVVLNRRGDVMYIRIVYAQKGPVKVLQVTGSLLILIIVCCCILLFLRSDC